MLLLLFCYLVIVMICVWRGRYLCVEGVLRNIWVDGEWVDGDMYMYMYIHMCRKVLGCLVVS